MNEMDDFNYTMRRIDMMAGELRSMKTWVKVLTLIVVLSVLLGCDVATPTGPNTELPPMEDGPQSNLPPVEVEEWWAKAQSKLAKYGIDASDVHAYQFRWVEKTEPFDCGDVENTAGCYDPDTYTITYQDGHEYVICHEAGHAILHKLKDSRRSCWEHTCMKETGPCYNEEPNKQ